MSITMLSTHSRKIPSRTRVSEPRLPLLLTFLATERGLAENSIHAYRRDLENLSEFLTIRKRDFQSAEARDYREYLHDQSRGEVDANGGAAAGGDSGDAAILCLGRREIRGDPSAA